LVGWRQTSTLASTASIVVGQHGSATRVILHLRAVARSANGFPHCSLTPHAVHCWRWRATYSNSARRRFDRCTRRHYKTISTACAVRHAAWERTLASRRREFSSLLVIPARCANVISSSRVASLGGDALADRLTYRPHRTLRVYLNATCGFEGSGMRFATGINATNLTR